MHWNMKQSNQQKIAFICQTHFVKSRNTQDGRPMQLKTCLSTLALISSQNQNGQTTIPAENIGNFLRDHVDSLMSKKEDKNRMNLGNLSSQVHNALKDLESEAELFENLLLSMERHLEAVTQARGGHTEY